MLIKCAVGKMEEDMAAVKTAAVTVAIVAGAAAAMVKTPVREVVVIV